MSEPWKWPRRLASGAANFGLITALTGVSAAAFGIISARQFGVRYTILPLLPEGHKPFRILHIGDMHLVAGDRKKINFVRGLADLKPDLVVNTGDNPGGADAIEDVAEALPPLLHTPGVFVAGSNDFYGPKPANPLRYLRAPSEFHDDPETLQAIDVGTMFDAFTRTGHWHQIGNTSITLPVRSDLSINFAGTHDAHMQADAWPGFDASDAAVPLRIAVTHAPYRRVLDAAVADGADLILAGHTHGGQVALPHYGAIVSNCDLPTGLAASLFRWRSRGQSGLVNVTAGIGTSPKVPIRTFCPPEAVVLDLVAQG